MSVILLSMMTPLLILDCISFAERRVHRKHPHQHPKNRYSALFHPTGTLGSTHWIFHQQQGIRCSRTCWEGHEIHWLQKPQCKNPRLWWKLLTSYKMESEGTKQGRYWNCLHSPTQVHILSCKILVLSSSLFDVDYQWTLCFTQGFLQTKTTPGFYNEYQLV